MNEFDETAYAYEKGYNDAQAIGAFFMIVQLCYDGIMTIRDGAAYLDMDIVDLQEVVRCMCVDNVPIDELPF